VMYNLGDGPCTVSDLAIVGSAEFAVVPPSPTPPITLNTGGYGTGILVAYTPSEIGADAGTLEITSDDPDEPTVSISLTGTGQ